MKSPVMIVGAPRSGTSMIMSMFKNFLGYKGHNEGHFFTLLYQLLNLSTRHQKNLESSDGSVKDFLILDQNVHLQDDLINLFTGYLKNIYGEESWFIKTPNHLAVKSIPLVRSMFPDLKLIYMKRRGIENVLSQSRKFGDGQFKTQYCELWSNCIETFFASEQHQETIIIDQLALLIDPTKVIDNILTFIEFEKNPKIAAQLKRYMHVNPVENTAKLTKHYIPLEETPWTDHEKELFLEHCESAMLHASYPITKNEVKSFQPTDSFLFSSINPKKIEGKNIYNPWTKLPPLLSQVFKIHPNNINEEPVTILINPSLQEINLEFKMVNAHLREKGVNVKIEESDKTNSTSTHLITFNLRSLEQKQIQLRTASTSPVIKIEISNEIGSSNYEYKQLIMKVNPTL